MQFPKLSPGDSCSPFLPQTMISCRPNCQQQPIERATNLWETVSTPISIASLLVIIEEGHVQRARSIVWQCSRYDQCQCRHPSDAHRSSSLSISTAVATASNQPLQCTVSANSLQPINFEASTHSQCTRLPNTQPNKGNARRKSSAATNEHLFSLSSYLHAFFAHLLYLSFFVISCYCCHCFLLVCMCWALFMSRCVAGGVGGCVRDFDCVRRLYEWTLLRLMCILSFWDLSTSVMRLFIYDYSFM